MAIPRRTFLRTTAAAVAATGLTPLAVQASHVLEPTRRVPEDRFDPWIEVDRSALQANVAEVRRLTGGRPILAVIKNNAYGLGLVMAAKVLETFPEVVAFAVVKMTSAFALREAGITKPIHLMALFPPSAAADLARHAIQPCLYNDSSL